MRTTEGRLEKQVQFWSLLGPFFILLTLFITLVRVSPTNLYLGVIALLSIPVCWKWKMYGLAGTIGVLAALVAYNYSELSTIERFWQVGVAIAISVGCVVTTLSFEEAENLINGLKVQSDSRLDNLWHLDEKLKTLKEQYETEKRALTEQLQVSTSDLGKLRTDLDSFEKLARIHREELQVAQEEKNKLLEEILQARTQADSMEEQLYQHSSEYLDQLKGELVTANDKIEEYATNIEVLRENYQTLENENEKIEILTIENGKLKTSLSRIEEGFKDLQAEKECIIEENIHTLKAKDLEWEKTVNAKEEELEGVVRAKEQERIDAVKAKDLEWEKIVNSKEQALKDVITAKEQERVDAVKAKEQELNKQIDALQSLVKKYQTQVVRTEVPAEESMVELQKSFRQVEGKYRQLTRQFKEKSEVLDTTRRELFYTEEKLMALKREVNEHQVYGLSESEVAMEKYLIQMSNQLDRETKNYQQEIDSLHELINSLVAKKT